jgi:hypothetical protein
MDKTNGILYEPDGGEGDGAAGAVTDPPEGEGAGTTDPPTPEEAQALREENERLKAAAAKSRTEAARRAKAEADAARKKAEDEGNVSELQKQLDSERQAREAAETKLVQTQAKTIARELGAVDAGDVVALLDWNSLVDPTDEAEVRQALRALLKAKPHLRKTTKDTDAGQTGGGEGSGKGTDMNTILRRAAGHRD